MKYWLRQKGIYTRLLAITTALFIMLFQTYWIWNNYRIQKVQLLKDVEYCLRDGMELITLQQISGNVVFSTGSDDSVVVNLDVMMKSQPRAHDLYKKDLTALERMEYLQVRSLNIMFTSSGTSGLSKNSFDSLLYATLRGRIKEYTGKEDGFVIYHYAPQGITTYPLGETIKAESTTARIDSVLNLGSAFSIHIEDLNLIILRQMLVLLILSVLYILLSFITLMLLLGAFARNRHLMEIKNNFTQNMTHELKLPISTLYIAAEALGKFNTLDNKEETKKYVDIIQKGLRYFSEIVEAILVNTRLQGRTLPMYPESVNLKGILEDVIEKLYPVLQKQHGKVDISGVPETLSIVADRRYFVHVFSNLIDNAIKYNAQQPVIVITAQKKADHTEILITDNGIGIPKKYRREIFTSYFRVPEHALRHVKGYGLGLYFVKSILQLHRGDIILVKTDEEGTILKITLPN